MTTRGIERPRRNLTKKAASSHLNTVTEKFAARLMALGDATGFTVYGNPSDELKEMLKGFNGEYMAPFRGFTRYS